MAHLPRLALVVVLLGTAFAKTGWAQFARGLPLQPSPDQLDSLRQVLAEAENPEDLSEAAFALGMAGYRTTPDSSFLLFHRALREANRLPPTPRAAPYYQAAMMLLNGHRREGRLDSARYYVKRGLLAARAGGDSLLVADALHNRAGLQRRDMRFEAATTDALNALALLRAEAPEDVAARSIYLKHLGRIRLEREDYPRAIAAFQDVLRLAETHPEEVPRIQRGMSLYFMAVAQASNGNYPEAEATLDRYARFLAERSDGSTSPEEHASSIYLLGDTTLALNLFLARYPRLLREGNGPRAGDAAANIASTYNDLGQFAKALPYARAALATDSLDTETFDFLLPELVRAHEGVGHHDSALYYLRLQNAITDSLASAAQAQRIDALEVEFGARQAKADLAVEAANLARVRTQRAGLLAALLALLVVAGLLIGIFRQRLRLSQRIAEQERELLATERLAHERERQLTAVRSMIRGQEAERKRIAQELHDGIGSLLTSTKAHLTVDDDPHGQSIGTAHAKGIHLLDEACVEVRKISHALMPQALTLDNFTAAVTDLAEGLQAGGVTPQVEVAGQLDKRVSESVQLSAYRILQELIANTLRHAEASEVFIQLMVDGDRLVLLYEDNGSGFDASAAPARPGLGLSGIESRVDVHGGELDVATAPGDGVSYTIVLPILVGQV